MQKKKKKLIQTGALDKHVRSTEATPKDWIAQHPDYSAMEYAVKEASDPSTEYLQSQGVIAPDKQEQTQKISKKRPASEMSELQSPPTKKNEKNHN